LFFGKPVAKLAIINARKRGSKVDGFDKLIIKKMIVDQPAVADGAVKDLYFGAVHIRIISQITPHRTRGSSCADH